MHTGRWLYWSNRSRIMKASMDGNNKTVVVDNNVEVFAFTIDYQNQVLYFVYWDNNRLNINSSNIDGSNTKLITQFLDHYLITDYLEIKVSLFGDLLVVSVTLSGIPNQIYEVRKNTTVSNRLELNTCHNFDHPHHLKVIRQPPGNNLLHECPTCTKIIMKLHIIS